MDSELFIITKLSLGLIKPKHQINVYFPYKGILSISKMVSPCDCSVPENDKIRSRIVVRYTPKEMSKHLMQRGHEYQTVEKTVAIYFFSQDKPDEEQRIELKFTAQVSKN